MNLSLPSMLRRLAALAIVALAGCASLDVKQQTIEQTEAVRQGPEGKPSRSITGFSPALRCMDNLMIDYGVRDVSTLVEDIFDQTKKVNAGARDMLITALSDMTRRSRAVRVVAFGRDATNVISFLASAQRQNPYEAIPPYDIKGSISQFDDNLIRNKKDLGIIVRPFVELGAARDASTSVLGLDLSVLATDNMSVLSGVTSRNSVVILRTGGGLDADAAYHKFGVNFSMSLSKSEGQTQALRGLIELAAIELIGKLTKTPYWKCLAGDPEANDEIRLEIADWFYAMAASRIELIGYFQNQLRHRGFYDGPIDGRFNPAIDEAIASYRAALGLSRKALLDEPFFNAYLMADHSKVERPKEPARILATQASPGAAAPRSGASGLRLALGTPDNRTQFVRGEEIDLLVTPSRDAHVYCFLQDEKQQVLRFFPNRFQADSRVKGETPLALPGTMRFRLFANELGKDETVACFGADGDVLARLPAAIASADLQPLAVASLDAVRSAFRNATSNALAEAYFRVQVR